MRPFWKSGEPFVWLTGSALAASLLMVAGLLGLILYNGLGLFWPRDLIELELRDGRRILGEITARELIPDPDSPLAAARHRLQVKQGNRDLTGADFVWVDEADIVARSRPADALVVERREWGNLYGRIVRVQDGMTVIGEGDEAGWTALQAGLPDARRLQRRIEAVEKDEIGGINAAQERARLALRRLAFAGVSEGPRVEQLRGRATELAAAYQERLAELNALRARATTSAVFRCSGDREKEVSLAGIVRVTPPNRLGRFDKAAVYASRLWEFVSADPREANTEGGVFPAIFGTVMMVLLMSVVVTPLGVLAAFYLREYSKQGAVVSAVRIAVNNLAGVPSIVYGVFGVGFFIYLVGGTIDRWFTPEMLPTPTFGTGGILWASLTLALLTVPVVIIAVEEGLAAVPRGTREASLALGATKLETTWRVVFPAVLPAVLTGMILAVARAAGEVAPLMLTGVVKLAPALPLDGTWPFLHVDRKFMHLGFHIYDVGFQSPNVDAARPMVFMTTLLLLSLVLLLNLTAILVRNRLRKRMASSGL